MAPGLIGSLLDLLPICMDLRERDIRSLDHSRCQVFRRFPPHRHRPRVVRSSRARDCDIRRSLDHDGVSPTKERPTTHRAKTPGHWDWRRWQRWSRQGRVVAPQLLP
jgi:hypothetical protein